MTISTASIVGVKTRSAAVRAACTAAALLLAAPPARADRDPLVPDMSPAAEMADPAASEDSTQISIGLAGVYKPEFEGSDDHDILPFPLVSVRNLYGVNLQGTTLSYDLVRRQGEERKWQFRWGPAISLDLGRDEDDSRSLDGLGDVDMGLLVGGFANARYGPVMLNLSGGQDVIDGHGGALIGVRLSVVLPVNDRLRVSPSFSATWASEDYMESYFGVTGAQAARSNYRPFSPSAGFKDVGLGVNAKYRIAGRWHATGMLSYKRLVGDAADSPIVEGPGGSRNQFMGLIGVAYDFSF